MLQFLYNFKMKKYKRGQKISSGAFGVVYSAQALEGELVNKSIAIKQVYKSEVVDREIKLLKELPTHPNIIECYEIIEDNEFERSIVMERGLYDLEALMESWEYPFCENVIKTIAKSTLQGLAHLYKEEVVHRDLKPSNIVVKSNQTEIIICDFGSATKVIKDKQYAIQGFTRWYKCPEMLFGSRHYAYEADIWSLGCILMELATGEPLFGGKSELEQISLISNFLGDPSPKNWPSITSLHDFGKIQFVQKNPKTQEELCKEYGISKELCKFIMRMIRYEGRASAIQLLEDQYLHQKSKEAIKLELGLFGSEKMRPKIFK